MRHLWLMARVIVIIVLTPLVAIAGLAMGQIYAVLVLLSLPFLLAYELIQRKAEEAALAERELDLLQMTYPDVPRHMLRQARRETLMQEGGHEVDARQLERDATAEMWADTAGQRAPDLSR
ncbi:hypothetical protein LJR290_007284 [Variovorax sp. LjRoot290]|uniref:hypothetical protein n=1 Tax=unclassified Variovorax TaxID=663243 RepID=UPI003ED03774